MIKLIYLLVMSKVLCVSSQINASDSPIGWAAVNDGGENDATGGGNTPAVYVTTLNGNAAAVIVST